MNIIVELLCKYILFNISDMAKRVTIMVDDELDKKLRQMQAKLIQKENKSISYSYVINLMLKDSLKK